jgi:hypothetical protein
MVLIEVEGREGILVHSTRYVNVTMSRKTYMRLSFVYMKLQGRDDMMMSSWNFLRCDLSDKLEHEEKKIYGTLHS